jgi:hypothetical protein
MVDTLHVLGQAQPDTNVLANVYTVPAAVMTVVSSLAICNRASLQVRVRVSVAVLGALDAPSQYLYFDVAIPANDTLVATIGITLSEGDVVRALSSNSTTVFSLFGVEVHLETPVTSKYAETGPPIDSFTWTVTHNLGSIFVIAQVRESASGIVTAPDITMTSANVVTVSSVILMAANSLKIVVLG